MVTSERVLAASTVMSSEHDAGALKHLAKLLAPVELEGDKH